MDYSKSKLNGDISEEMVKLKLLRLGMDVSVPLGDRLPYDLVADNGYLFKIQVKTGWYHNKSKSYICDNRRSRSNQRNVYKIRYGVNDFDFAIVVIHELNIFYVFPSDVFLGYASNISLAEGDERQRRPKSVDYRERWDLLLNWTPLEVIPEGLSVKLGETCSDGNPEPSPINNREGVET